MLGPAGAGTFRFRDGCCGGGTPAETSSQTTLTGLPASWTSGTSFSDGPASAYGVAGSAAPPPPPPPPPPPVGTVLFGTQTILPSADNNVAGNAEAFQYTATTSGTLSSLKAYIDLPSLATRVVAGVYTDAAGHPGTLLAQGSLEFPVKGAWNTIPVSTATITAGQRYWIALLSPAGTGTLAFRDRCCGAAGPTETSLQTSLATLPGTWSTGTVFRDGPASAYGLG
jgi:hypothetical protein